MVCGRYIHRSWGESKPTLLKKNTFWDGPEKQKKGPNGDGGNQKHLAGHPGDINWRIDGFGFTSYPLVIEHSELENHHAINRKIHYFYGHFQLLFVCLPEGTTCHVAKPKTGMNPVRGVPQVLVHGINTGSNAPGVGSNVRSQVEVIRRPILGIAYNNDGGT